MDGARSGPDRLVGPVFASRLILLLFLALDHDGGGVRLMPKNNISRDEARLRSPSNHNIMGLPREGGQIMSPMEAAPRVLQSSRLS